MECVSVPYQCGVIEVVPDSKSRDEIGKQTQVSLREYFHSMHGPEDSIPYQEVQYFHTFTHTHSHAHTHTCTCTTCTHALNNMFTLLMYSCGGYACLEGVVEVI